MAPREYFLFALTSVWFWAAASALFLMGFLLKKLDLIQRNRIILVFIITLTAIAALYSIMMYSGFTFWVRVATDMLTIFSIGIIAGILEKKK